MALSSWEVSLEPEGDSDLQKVSWLGIALDLEGRDRMRRVVSPNLSMVWVVRGTKSIGNKVGS